MDNIIQYLIAAIVVIGVGVLIGSKKGGGKAPSFPRGSGIKALYILHRYNDNVLAQAIRAGINTFVLPMYDAGRGVPGTPYLSNAQIEELCRIYSGKVRIYIAVVWDRPWYHTGASPSPLKPVFVDYIMEQANNMAQRHGVGLLLDTENYSKKMPFFEKDSFPKGYLGPLQKYNVRGEFPYGLPILYSGFKGKVFWFTEHTYTKDRTDKIYPKLKRLNSAHGNYEVVAGIFMDEFDTSGFLNYYKDMLSKYGNVWIYSHGKFGHFSAWQNLKAINDAVPK